MLFVERNGILFERRRDLEGRFLPMRLPMKLSPCPWCGSFVGVEGNDSYWVQCPECCARGPCVGSEDDAATEWNAVFGRRQ